MVASDIATISATLGGLLIAFLAIVAQALSEANSEKRSLRPSIVGRNAKGSVIVRVTPDFFLRVPGLTTRIIRLRVAFRLGVILSIVNLIISPLALWEYYGDSSLVSTLFYSFWVDIFAIVTAILMLGLWGLET
jgi:hypothetical protein